MDSQYKHILEIAYKHLEQLKEQDSSFDPNQAAHHLQEISNHKCIIVQCPLGGKEQHTWLKEYAKMLYLHSYSTKLLKNLLQYMNENIKS